MTFLHVLRVEKTAPERLMYCRGRGKHLRDECSLGGCRGSLRHPCLQRPYGLEDEIAIFAVGGFATSGAPFVVVFIATLH